jgi:hypothetical protein
MLSCAGRPGASALFDLGRRPAHAEHHHQHEDPLQSALEDVGDGDEALTQRGVPVDAVEFSERRQGIERGLDGVPDQVVLLLERPEDRPLGHPGRLGDLPRRHLPAVLAQQRDRRHHEGRTTVLRGHGPGAAALIGLLHRRSIAE